MRKLRRALVLPLFALVFAAGTAHADPSAADKESARSLAEQGDKLFAAHDYAGALKMYKGAHTIMGVPTTGVRVARAQELAGLLVEARDTFLQVARYPQKPDEPPPFTSAREEAGREAQALVVRIPSIEVEVSGPPTGAVLTIAIDGAVLPAEAAGLPHKVNPGVHHVKVSASGFADGATDVTVKEADLSKVSIALVPGDVSDATVAPAAEAHGAAPAGAHHGKRVAGFVVGGVGVVALGVGAVFGLTALAKKSDRDQHCNPAGTICDQTGIDDDTHGRTAATISTIGFAAGIVGVGLGGYLLLTSSSSGSVSIAPSVGANSGGLSLRGAF